MCGRFNVLDLAGALLWLFEMSEGPDQPPRYNITPSQPIAAVRMGWEGAWVNVLGWPRRFGIGMQSGPPPYHRRIPPGEGTAREKSPCVADLTCLILPARCCGCLK